EPSFCVWALIHSCWDSMQQCWQAGVALIPARARPRCKPFTVATKGIVHDLLCTLVLRCPACHVASESPQCVVVSLILHDVCLPHIAVPRSDVAHILHQINDADVAIWVHVRYL